jgi:hypothetical protein
LQEFDHDIGFFLKKPRHFFAKLGEQHHFCRRKLPKIAENCDHNIDPCLTECSFLKLLLRGHPKAKITKSLHFWTSLILTFFQRIMAYYAEEHDIKLLRITFYEPNNADNNTQQVSTGYTR